MDVWPRLPALARVVGWAEKSFLVSLAAWLLSGWLEAATVTRLILFLAVIFTGGWTGIKWLRVGIRKAIWRLRNRLLVAYLFIAVVPTLLIGAFAYLGSIFLAAQIAVYLVSTEFDRRVQALKTETDSLARVPPLGRERAWERMRTLFGDALPDLGVLVRERGTVRYRSNPNLEPPPEGYGETSGTVVRGGFLYLWARSVAGNTEVTALSPLTRSFLASLAPGIGEVFIVDSGDDSVPMRLHNSPAATSPARRGGIPPPRSRLDPAVTWGVAVPVAVWQSPQRAVSGLLAVRFRVSTVMDVVSRPQAQGANVLYWLYLIAGTFFVVELISLYIGVSITRTITGAFNSLYEGTERIRQGDFSHRIEVRGGDQMATVSDSFNRMTENLERLLVVAKEKERIQAELEIAREVQRQLYPKSVPSLSRLEIRAQCTPARMVSGDYYDYQSLRESSAALAIGDVAGKGISAALLMATLQAALRTHVRACLEQAAAGNGGESHGLSTSRLVKQLNEQLFADTAPEKYATFYFGVYEDDAGTLTYTNAGHLPPLLIRRGSVTMLEVNGMVVGAFPFARYGESRIQLESGDLLVCYTDGVTEPENEYGELFGEQRLINVILRNAHRETDRILAAVVEAVQDWTRSPELQDDMTLLIARRQ
jgi:sigma-B regulation protein RsbU (phosphoserine phosphatase)